MKSSWFKRRTDPPPGGRRIRYSTCVGCGTGLLLAVVVALLGWDDRGDTWFHQVSYDLPFTLRMASGANPPAGFLVIYMDEDSHRPLNQPFDQPWLRELHAELLDRLNTAGARLVGFDVLFSRETEAPKSGAETRADEALVAAMQTRTNVVIASHVRQTSHAGRIKVLTLEPPEPRLAAAAAAVGVSEVTEDDLVVVRKLTRQVDVGDNRPLPTFAWEAARVLGAAAVTNAAPASARWLLNYYGPPRTFRSLSYANALLDAPLTAFTNAIVLVGDDHPIRSGGMAADMFANPFRVGSKRYNGVEIQATALANLWRGEWLRRLPGAAEFLLLLALGGAAGVTLPRFRPQRSVPLAAAAILVVSLAGVLAQWGARLAFPWVAVVVQVAGVTFWAVFFRALRSYVEREVLSRSLALYLSPKQAAHILQRPHLLQPGGAQQTVSILTSDIANFSRISERMAADDLVGLLNAYYEEAIGCVHATDGTVVNLIGDAIFAVWNAPQPQGDHRERACRAALLLRACSERFNGRPDVPPLGTRVGLHCGGACVGNVGSTQRFFYTAIGEAVNLTFRLEGLNKLLDTAVLATRAFIHGLEQEFQCRSVGSFRFKGFDAVVEVVELLDRRTVETPNLPWLEPFAWGLHHFQRQNFDAAESTFKDVLKLRPDDGPAKFYLERVAEFRRDPPPRHWAGEIELREK